MLKRSVISDYQWVKTGILAGLSLAAGIFSYYPGLVEKWYSLGFYPAFGAAIRLITGWIPFSIGDLLYTIFILYIIYQLFQTGRALYRKSYSPQKILVAFLKVVRVLLVIYLVFKVFWGFNYDREGIEKQLGIAKTSYSIEEVTTLTNQLIDLLNETRRQIPDTVLPSPSLDSLYLEAYRCYGSLSDEYGFLNYRNLSVKGSLFSFAGDYLGFTGYYNPFTGEAQVRTDIPRILLPYITCHEMAHQLGYASESEANFVGYLAALRSKNSYFRYSVYQDLFSYAQQEEVNLYGKQNDFKKFSYVFEQNRKRLDTLVKKDRREIREFFQQRKNRISPAVSNLYDQYLKLNKQLQGVNSYNEVIGWVLAYQKKYANK
ncbi:MAG: DUF3810 domain-containing protein [Bacteroidota bacterium]|nr:DUF3810 domain-containing protein [Bacteroidota bacterium]